MSDTSAIMSDDFATLDEVAFYAGVDRHFAETIELDSTVADLDAGWISTAHRLT